MMQGVTRPALFLDRDGVINVDHAYVYRKEDFHFIDGIFALVAAAKKAGYLVVVVTNQAGIGRGFYTEEDFDRLMSWVCEQFVAREGCIDGVYYCPDHPEHGLGRYRQESRFRKPGPGMILQAAQEHAINLQKSILVGDKLSDIESGLRAGIGTLLYFGPEDDVHPAIKVRSLSEVLPYLAATVK